jgi:hypothetical protein
VTAITNLSRHHDQHTTLERRPARCRGLAFNSGVPVGRFTLPRPADQSYTPSVRLNEVTPVHAAPVKPPAAKPSPLRSPRSGSAVHHSPTPQVERLPACPRGRSRAQLARPLRLCTGSMLRQDHVYNNRSVEQAVTGCTT